MAFHGPSYGLDAELEAKRKAAYDPKLENEAREWIVAVTGRQIDNFQEDLKDGSILIDLVNRIKPGSSPKANTSKMPFKQMENIGNFLTACSRLGQAPIDCFQTVDLFEAKNMNQVVHHIHALGRIAQRIGFQGPVIGVKLADSHKVNFTDEQLKAGHSELGLLTAGQVKGSVSKVDRSADVNKNYQQQW